MTRPVLALMLLAGLSPLARGQTYTWLGGGGNGNWSTSANWDTLPPAGGAAAATVVLTGTTQPTQTQDRGNPFQLNTLQFTSGTDFTVGGSPLAFNGAGSLGLDSNSVLTLNTAVSIGAGGLTVSELNNGLSRVVLAGPVSGGALTLNGSGFGGTQVYLTRTGNSFGAVAVTNGQLGLAAVNALARTQAVTVDDSLQLDPTSGLPAGVTAGNYDQRVASLGGGQFGLTDLGTATLTVGFGGASGSYAGSIGGTTGVLVKVGTGTQTLTRTAADFASQYGRTVVAGGTLALSGDGIVLDGTGLVRVAAGAALQLDGTLANSRLSSTVPVVGLGGTVSVTGTNAQMAGQFTAGTGQSTVTVTTGGSLTFNSYSVQPGATVEFAGGGLVGFTNAPTLTGGILPSAFTGANFVSVSGGVVQPFAGYTTSLAAAGSTDTANESGSPTVAASQMVNALKLSPTGNQTVTLSSGVTLNLTAGALLANTSGGSSTVTGGVGLNLGSGTGYVTVVGSSPLTLSTPVTTGGLAKAGGGELVLNASLASAGSQLSVNAGTLTLNPATVSGGQLPASITDLRVSAGATLNVAPLMNAGLTIGNSQTLSGNGTVAGTLRVGNGGTLAPSSLAEPGTAGGSGTLRTSNLQFAPGGTLRFTLTSVGDGVTNSPITTSQVIVTGTLDLSGLSAASPFLVQVKGLRADLTNGAAGSVSDFDPSQPYTWTLVSTTGGLVLPGGGFNSNLFSVNSGELAAPASSFNVTQSGNNLLLSFNPVPEPTGLLLAVSVVATGWRAWRIWRGRPGHELMVRAY